MCKFLVSQVDCFTVPNAQPFLSEARETATYNRMRESKPVSGVASQIIICSGRDHKLQNRKR
jgi:hypothetical protein